MTTSLPSLLLSLSHHHHHNHLLLHHRHDHHLLLLSQLVFHHHHDHLIIAVISSSSPPPSLLSNYLHTKKYFTCEIFFICKIFHSKQTCIKYVKEIKIISVCLICRRILNDAFVVQNVFLKLCFV